MTETTQMAQPTRRRVVRNAAWAAPVVLTASAAPAAVASVPKANPTVATVNPLFYRTVFTRTPASCNTSTNPQMGFVDAMACGSPAIPASGDCTRNPSSSNGYWFESTTPGTVTTNSITSIYTFAQPVVLDECPVSGTANTSGTVKWTSCNIYNGWTITQTSPTTIVASYTAPQTVDVSTATAGSGWATGYFFNFHMPNGCYASGVQKVSTATTWNYTTSTGAKTWTKNTGPTGI